MSLASVVELKELPVDNDLTADLHQLEKDMSDLQDVVSGVQALINQQGESIDHIETVTESADVNVVDAAKILKDTHDKYNKLELTKTSLKVVVIGLGVGALVGGPIGLAVSAHLIPVVISMGAGSVVGGSLGWLATKIAGF